ncbi:MAG: YitT family protein [Acholeplasmataceae bacterium]
MKKIINYFKSENYQLKIKPEVFRTITVVFFTLVYSIGVAWFLEASKIPLYTSGIPGVAQLIRDFLHYFIGVNIANYERVIVGVLTVLLNIPILILGWVGVSKKFVIYSLVSVLIQAVVLAYMPIIDLGLSDTSYALTSTILGGLLIGIGIGGALRYGTSTGGFDIVAQYVSFKKGKSVGLITMLMNVVIGVLGGFITSGHIFDENGIPIAAGVVISYTILRLLISTLMTDRLHTSYQYTSVEIITSHSDEIVKDILVNLHRGVTLMNVEGGFTKSPKTLILVIISSYELSHLKQITHRIDPNAFMIVRPAKQVIGNFAKKTIA